VPIAGHGTIAHGRFELTGLVAELDGSRIIKAKNSGPVDATQIVGVELAEQLVSRGAGEILAKLQTMESANDER